MWFGVIKRILRWLILNNFLLYKKTKIKKFLKDSNETKNNDFNIIYPFSFGKKTLKNHWL